MEFLIAIDKGIFFALDNQVVPRLSRLGIDSVMLFFTHLGDARVLRPVMIVAVLVLALCRRFLPAALVLVAFLGAHSLTNATKSLVQRPRPDPVHSPLDRPQSYSFPSGHALEATAMYVTLALVAVPRRARRWGLLGSLILVFFIGFSRMYLGVHYATDVVAGWAAGLTLALTCSCLQERLQPYVPRQQIVHQP